MTAAARMALEATGLLALAVLAWITGWATNDGLLVLLSIPLPAVAMVLGWLAGVEYLRGAR